MVIWRSVYVVNSPISHHIMLLHATCRSLSMFRTVCYTLYMHTGQSIRRMAVFIFAVFALGAPGAVVFGQEAVMDDDTVRATTSTTTEFATTTEESGESGSLLEALITPKQDLTQPEEQPVKDEIQLLLEKRPAEKPGFFNLIAYWVQKAIALGIPANTIVLILLVPVVATLVTFVRVVIGLPSLEMLVPIALAFAFVAVGITVGLIILSAVVLASFVSRGLLRSVPIMYFPKRSLSHLLLALFVFGALTVAIALDIESIKNLSIFPILILTLLGDSIVSVQLHKSFRDTIVITAVTISIALIGFVMATSLWVRDLIILWPEVVLLTIPINLLLGRYFGLRIAELLRFKTLESYGSE